MIRAIFSPPIQRMVLLKRNSLYGEKNLLFNQNLSVSNKKEHDQAPGIKTNVNNMVGVFVFPVKSQSLFLSISAEPLVRQVKRTRIKREDFHILKVIGRGTFSEVNNDLLQ